MDFSQKKLSKNEWCYIEIPVEQKEIDILNLIVNGFYNTTIKVNHNHSLLTFTKIQKTQDNDIYLFQQFFEPTIAEFIKKNKECQFIMPKLKSKTKPKQADIIRIQTLTQNIVKNRNEIFEFVLMDFAMNIYQHKCHFNFYSLLQFKKNMVYPTINPFIMKFVEYCMEFASHKTTIESILFSSVDVIENNSYLMKYEDFQLYQHQRQIFDLFRDNPSPKLVLYMAPTGTGKTLTPLGLSQQYKIIFVCAARHIGLSLGKSAISIGKRIAFAFGCETASDIRLHNLSASTFIKHNKSGGIYKVDNSNGEKVDIMICDVQSYLTAMHYMLAFNNEETIVTYWDEPTITMDYENHELHEIIHQNWTNNKISKLVLSSATLPRPNEINATISSFQEKFNGATVECIDTFDCKKSISLIGPDGKCVLPHVVFNQYKDIIECVQHCKLNKSLLRYFDLSEIIRFIKLAYDGKHVSANFDIRMYFNQIDMITMTSIKLFYLELLENIDYNSWTLLYNKSTQTLDKKFDQYPNGEPLRKIKSMMVEPTITSSHLIKKSNSLDTPQQSSNSSSGILFTTNDAHTLTDGPSIYITNDVMKIANFYIQQSKIPDVILADIWNKITTNNSVIKEIDVLEKTIEDEMGKDMEKEKKLERENFSGNIKRLKDKLQQLNSIIQPILMNEIFVPNTKQHQEKWCNNYIANAFVPIVDETIIIRIMAINVDDKFKLLLLLGIGVFDYSYSTHYLDIIKELADKQHLFMIIASSDYIFGTNYPFCHAIVGKDLASQESSSISFHKLLQAFGRVGRQNSQQNYDIRLRHPENVKTILTTQPSCEITNFQCLFV